MPGAASAVPWNTDELYRYLRSGHTQHHGIAGGPMADVVRELAVVPDVDIRAMATYVASFNPVVTADEAAAQARHIVVTAAAGQGRLLGPAQRMFDSACASCHHDGDGPTLGEQTADTKASVEREATGNELRVKIAAAVEELPDEQREVFLMREVANLPFKEIAEITNVPENTVKSRMRYALERLQAALSDYEEYARALK